MIDNTISPLTPVSDGGIGGFFGTLLNVFDRGATIYQSTQERKAAIDLIEAETVKTAAPVVAAPSTTETGLLGSAKTALNNSTVAFIAAGILGVILLVMILNRRR